MLGERQSNKVSLATLPKTIIAMNTDRLLRPKMHSRCEIVPLYSPSDILRSIMEMKNLLLNNIPYTRDIPRSTLLSSIIRSIAKEAKRRLPVALSLINANGENIGIILLQESEWDSKHFGMGISKIKLILFNRDVNILLRRLLIRRAIDLARSKLIIARIPLHDIRTIQALELEGGLLTDILLTFHRKLPVDSVNQTFPKHIRNVEVVEANEFHEKQIAEISKEVFTMNHFLFDPYLPREKCLELYSKWALNCLREASNINLIAKLNGKVIGFILCKVNNIGLKCSYGIIDLIGVKREYQGMGVGSLLLHEALRRISRCAPIVYVGTQASNIPAVRMYERFGFKLVFTEATFHIWR